jgi:hypothetical protein
MLILREFKRSSNIGHSLSGPVPPAMVLISRATIEFPSTQESKLNV